MSSTPSQAQDDIRALKKQVEELESIVKKLVQTSNKQSAIINQLTTRKLPTMRSEILELKAALSRMRTSGRD